MLQIFQQINLIIFLFFSGKILFNISFSVGFKFLIINYFDYKKINVKKCKSKKSQRDRQKHSFNIVETTEYTQIH